MPMGEEYHDQLKSNFADFANACGRDGGAITAACFLAKSPKPALAHLDIAGTAYLTGSHKAAPAAGAAADGFPARPDLSTAAPRMGAPRSTSTAQRNGPARPPGRCLRLAEKGL